MHIPKPAAAAATVQQDLELWHIFAGQHGARTRMILVRTHADNEYFKRRVELLIGEFGCARTRSFVFPLAVVGMLSYLFQFKFFARWAFFRRERKGCPVSMSWHAQGIRIILFVSSKWIVGSIMIKKFYIILHLIYHCVHIPPTPIKTIITKPGVDATKTPLKMIKLRVLQFLDQFLIPIPLHPAWFWVKVTFYFSCTDPSISVHDRTQALLQFSTAPAAFLC